MAESFRDAACGKSAMCCRSASVLGVAAPLGSDDVVQLPLKLTGTLGMHCSLPQCRLWALLLRARTARPMIGREDKKNNAPVGHARLRIPVRGRSRAQNARAPPCGRRVGGQHHARQAAP